MAVTITEMLKISRRIKVTNERDNGDGTGHAADGYYDNGDQPKNEGQAIEGDSGDGTDHAADGYYDNGDDKDQPKDKVKRMRGIMEMVQIMQLMTITIMGMVKTKKKTMITGIRTMIGKGQAKDTENEKDNEDANADKHGHNSTSSRILRSSYQSQRKTLESTRRFQR